MKEELEKLREKMAENGIDTYMIPTEDFHGSEYVGDHFRCAAFVSGFSGEGTLVITMQEAKLFTDGRYFIQAEQELADSGFDLMRMGDRDVPSPEAYAAAETPEDGCIGFDGRVVDYQRSERLRCQAEKKGIRLSGGHDLAGEIWKDRPALPHARVWILEDIYAGENAVSKLKRLRRYMEEKKTVYHLISSLDDIAWLLNLRGGDVPCNPVFLAFLLLSADEALLYANAEAFDPDARRYLETLGVGLRDYTGIYADICALRDSMILLEKKRTSYTLINGLHESMVIRDEMLPTSLWKSVKNETEIENLKKAHIKDGVALTKYLYFLKTAFDEEGRLKPEAETLLRCKTLTEISGAELLERYRREQDGFFENSFETISAYRENAALPHYHAVPGKQDKEIRPEGLYLVDSGGQYLEGTTDVTRTVVMGKISDTERRHFTRVCQGMLRLGDIVFPEGTCGFNIDLAARSLLWKEGLNYNHGTGHGVGFCLNVHERPNSIRPRVTGEQLENAALRPGQVTSDEPGMYIEGSHGIRTENLILCVPEMKTDFGTFYGFTYLTMAPIDRDGLDPELMTREDILLLDRYHKTVFEALSPYFDGERLEWLSAVTAPLRGEK